MNPAEFKEHNRYTTIMKAAMYYHMLMKHSIQSNREHFTKMQMDILFILNTMRENESETELNMTALSAHLSVSKEQTTRAIQPLIEAGLVDRRKNEQNKRSVFVSITDKGYAELHKRHKDIERDVEEFLSQLSEDEFEELYQTAKKTNELMGKAVERLGVKPCHSCRPGES